jgi:hypothetical protein
MGSEYIDLALVFAGMGLLFIGVGIGIRAGKKKGWWLMWDTPITPIAAAHIMIPGGIALLFWSLAALFPDLDERVRLFECGMLLFMIAVILAIWRPRWLVPKWLLWLEDNHGEIYAQLREEAQKLGAREWEKRVSTQEGLEEWAMEVRRKYGWDHPDAGNPFP